MRVSAVAALCFLMPALLCSQPSDPYGGARAAMAASIEQQKSSVQRQSQVPRPAAPSFFTVPWLEPAAFMLGPAAEPECEPVPPEQIGPLIEEISQREGLTPDLLRAVIRKESGFRPCVVSQKGAQGLMQLMPATAAQYGVSDAFDPKQNLNAGARFLREMLNRYGGDPWLALGAYNAGPGRVDAAGGLPLIPETLNYVLDIQQMLKTK